MKIEKLEKGLLIWGCGQCFNEGRNAGNVNVYRILSDCNGPYHLQLCETHLKQLAKMINTKLKEN